MPDEHQQPETASTAPATIKDDALRAALEEANLPTLLLVLAQLTGNDRWLSDPCRPTPTVGLGDHDSAGLPDDVQAAIRHEALDVITAWREGRLAPQPVPGPARIARMLSVALAEDVAEEYGPLLAEEMGLASRDVDFPSAPGERELSVLVIGAGMSGICMAVKLQQAGVAYTVLEKNTEAGGTWLENLYPGCGVDTPSHLYSFSFAHRPDWDGYFAERHQVHEYLRGLVDDYELRDNIAFGTEVVSARWHDDDDRWAVHVRHTDGSEETLTARVLISAVGHFNRPSIPPIKGLDSFPGPCMHTAQWDESVDVAGKRVAVVGTGASAMQLVPALAGRAEKVIVFQRSRQWCIPHPNCGRPVSPAVQHLLANVPFYAAWYRLRHFWRFGDRLHAALQMDPAWPDQHRSINKTNDSHRRFLTGYIESELKGRPDLVELSVPDYPAYGKRPLIDHGWYRTIRRADVELIEGSVSEVCGNRIVTADGRQREVDVLALATGFKTLRLLDPIEIVGRSGRTLRETWGADDARAYLGISVPDFPNFFILFGPNTSAGHGGSAFLTTEFQVRYVLDLLARMVERGISSVDVRRDVHDAYNAELDDALSRTVWAHPEVTNYYRNAAGRIVGTCPWKYIDYWQRTLTADLRDYWVDTAAERAAA